MMLETITLFEGESKVLRRRVRGTTGFLDLTGYTLSGSLRTATNPAIAGSLSTSLDPDDSTWALFGVPATLTAGRGGSICDIETDIVSGSGASAYPKVYRFEFIRRWAHTAETAVPGLVVENEVPSGAPDGINTVFALLHAPDPVSSLDVYVNGVIQTAGVDFTLTGIYITFLAGSVPPNGALILADYRYTAIGTTVTILRLVDDETPSGTLNGVNTDFILVRTPVAGSLKLFVNGIRQVPGVNHTVTGATITFLAGYIPDIGDVLNADYRY